MREKLKLGAASVALMAFSLAAAASAQSADPSGDANTQAQLTVGQPVESDFSPAGDSDWYRLHVERGRMYHITLDGVSQEGGDAVDPTLTIYAPNGDQLAFNDDSEESLNSILDYTPSQSGDVFIEAKPFADQATGRYHLAVAARELPEDAVGNDAHTQARVAPGAPVSGSLDYAGDVDWYRLSTREGQMYTITMEGDGDPALSDTVVRVVSTSGEELASNDDYGDGLNSRVLFIPQHSGDVFVSAQSFADQGAGGYRLNIEAATAPPDEASATTGTRGQLAVGGHVEGNLGAPQDHDWFRIRLQQGQSYRFALNGAGGENALADPLLRIHNASGEEVGSDDDGGPELNSYLEFTAPSTGVYYLDVGSFVEDGMGRYTLSAAAGDIPADASTDVSLAASGDSREGQLAPAGDTDWYRIDLDAGQGARFRVASAEGENALGDPLIIVHGPDGAELARDDDSGGNLNSWLEFVAPTAGAYYLEVRGFTEDAAGRYNIELTPGEIGDSTDTAEQLDVTGAGRVGVINSNEDVDWFAVNLVEGRPYRINVVGGSDDGLADPVLTLFDHEGHQIATDDDGGSGANSYLSFASPTGGLYFAAVSSFNHASKGRYQILLTDTDVPGNTGTDEALDQAGDDRTSSIDMPGDLDNYRIEVEAGAHYVIEVRADGEHPLGDPFVAVLNTDGERVTSDDDSGPSLDARLRFSPTEAGTYYIQASGLGGSTGGYKVSIVRQ